MSLTDEQLALVALGVGGAIYGATILLKPDTKNSAKAAYLAGSPTASYQAPRPNVTDYLMALLAQKQAMGERWAVTFVPVNYSYSPIQYPNTPVNDAKKILNEWLKLCGIRPDSVTTVNFDLDMTDTPKAARECVKVYDLLYGNARDTGFTSGLSFGGAVNLPRATTTSGVLFLHWEDSVKFWDRLQSCAAYLAAEKQFVESDWSRLRSSIGEAASEMPANLVTWTAQAGNEVIEYAGGLVGRAAGGILGGLLANPLVLALAATVLTFAVAKGVK